MDGGLAACVKCGSELPPLANYCPNCGRTTGRTIVEEFDVAADELVNKTKEILHDATVTKLIVEDEKGRTLLEIPVVAGLVGVLIAPWLAALGAIAALATKCRIKVEKKA